MVKKGSFGVVISVVKKGQFWVVIRWLKEAVFLLLWLKRGSFGRLLVWFSFGWLLVWLKRGSFGSYYCG